MGDLQLIILYVFPINYSSYIKGVVWLHIIILLLSYVIYVLFGEEVSRSVERTAIFSYMFPINRMFCIKNTSWHEPNSARDCMFQYMVPLRKSFKYGGASDGWFSN